MAKSAIASIRFVGDSTSAVKAAATTERAVSGMSSRIAKAAGAAAIAAGAAATALGVKAVSMAADLEQSAGAVDAVFKSAATQMKGFSDTAATTVGLTKNEYNELAVLLGSQLKNGGTSIDQLGAKTNDLITVGSDLSAMFGGSTADAVAALSSALKGERDPIERYGVSLNQAAIDAEAAALGFTKVGGSLSAEANQAATLSLIMKQTSAAHGAFARESDTLSHKQQVLKASMGNIVTTIGEGLLPYVSMAASGLVAIMPSVERAAVRFRDFAVALSEGKRPAWIAELPSTVAPARAALDTVAAAASRLGAAWTAARGPATAFVSSIAAPALPAWITALPGRVAAATTALASQNIAIAGLGAAWTAARGPAAAFFDSLRDSAATDGVVATVQGLGDRLGAAFAAAGVSDRAAAIFDRIRTAAAPVAPLFAGLGAAFAAYQAKVGPLGGLAARVVPMFVSLGQNIAKLAPALRFVLGPWGLLITGLVTALTTSKPFRDAVLGLAKSLGGLAVTVGQTLATVLSNLATTLLPALASLFPVIVTAITNLATNLAPLVTTIATTVVPLLGSLIANILPPLAAAFGAIVAAVVPLVATLVSQLVPVIGTIVSSVIPPLLGILAAILPVIPPIVSVIMTLVTTLAKVLVPVVQALVPVIRFVFELVARIIGGALTVVMGLVKVFVGLFTGDWRKMADGVKDIFVGLWNIVTAGVTTAFNTISSLVGKGLDKAKTLFKSGLDAVAGFFTSMWSSISTAFTDGVAKVEQWARDIPNKIKNFITRTTLRVVGSDLVQGMIDGVGSMGSALWNAAQNMGRTAVNSIKSALGIASPSKVARQLGRFFGEGMALGVTDERPAVLDAYKRLADVPPPNLPPVSLDVAANVTSLRARSGGDRAPAAPVHIDVTFTGLVTDPVAVARQIIDTVDVYRRATETDAQVAL